MTKGDSESDVSKALAAFGAPPLKYRSFTQAAIRSAPMEPEAATAPQAADMPDFQAASPAPAAAPAALAAAPLAPAPLTASRTPPTMLRPAPLAPAPVPAPVPFAAPLPVVQPRVVQPAAAPLPEPDFEPAPVAHAASGSAHEPAGGLAPMPAPMPPPVPTGFAAEAMRADFLASEVLSPSASDPVAAEAEPVLQDGDISLPRLFRLLSASPASQAPAMRDASRSS